jgi:hypothetical protein
VHGRGASLGLTSSSSQGVEITTPFLPLYNRSWTFEAWIYPTNLSNGDRAIIGQCETFELRRCLHLIIRNYKLHFGFLDDDLPGIRTLNLLTWYHLGFIFDRFNRKKRLFLDGELENENTSGGCYEGTNGTLTFGMERRTNFEHFFDGLIDQVVYTSRAKTDDEIRRDATLTFHFSFDNDTLEDIGPLRLQPTATGQMQFVAGRVRRALFISNHTHSYLLVRNLVLLGTSNRAHSFVLWIRPHRIRAATIIHFSEGVNGIGPWHQAMLGLSSNGQVLAFSDAGGPLNLTGPVIPTNNWTHIGMTYSSVDGWHLYVNGNVADNAGAGFYWGPGPSNYLFLGSAVSGVNSWTHAIVSGQYEGDIDEFQVYSRKLSTSEIFALANPLP